MADTTASGPRRRPGSAAFAARDWLTYGVVVLVWGTSWIALKMQLGVVAPEVSLFWRIGLAALIMLAWTALSAKPLRFGAADHLRFLGLGFTLFSLNFTLFYYGGQAVASGLLAVVFSLASVFNILLGAALRAQPIRLRTGLGALLGVLGVALMFWPEVARTSSAALYGLVLCMLGTLFFCLGNLLSASVQERGIPVISASAWGMLYGAALLAGAALLRGEPFVVEPTFRYLGSLIWLAVVASVVAFAAYLTLLGRVGAERAGYSTVMFPVVALLISTAFEGYVWTAPALAGLLFVMGGNVLVLGRQGATYSAATASG